MKNYNYMSLSCLKPYNSGFDGFQSTDCLDFSLFMGNNLNNYDYEGAIDNTCYQQLICGDDNMELASQFSYISSVVPSFLPTTMETVALESPPPMEYQCNLPSESSLKIHSLLAQPYSQPFNGTKCSTEGKTPQTSNVIKDVTTVDIPKSGKKRKAVEQLIDVRQMKMGPVRRSQKLSEKISALQELVSPYGKTDTASVLHEACIYIKIIHQELRRLSISYFEARPFYSQFQGEVERQSDLRSRGLCLVPISMMKRLTRSENWAGQDQNQNQTASRSFRKPRSL